MTDENKKEADAVASPKPKRTRKTTPATASKKTVNTTQKKATASSKSTTTPKTARKTTPSRAKSAKQEVSNVDESSISKSATTTENVKPARKKSTTSRTTRSKKTADSTVQLSGTTPELPVDTLPELPKDEEVKTKATPKKQVRKTPSRSTKKSVSAEHTATPVVEEQQLIVEDTPDTIDEAADTPALKSRRGRRGGRGKRGKGRQITEKISAEDSTKLTPTKAKQTQSTSVAEGKPGRARASVGKKAATTSGKRRTMFISLVSGEQVEVALTEEGAIHEYYLEMLHQAKTKNNIYKGVVHNVDTNLQAAFINYGAAKNGFLQIDEIHPEYYQSHHESAKGKKYPPIQQVIKPGQEILVQVVKEPTGNKGAFLTTWLSLAGRFLVLTPGQEQIGISRKVDSEDERTRLREMMEGIEPGAGLGVIVRTVSAGTSKTTLKNDLQYLKRVWKEIRKRGVSEAAPLLVYQEPKLAERAIRDYLTDDVHEVWVDNAEMAEKLREIVALLFPRKKDLVRVHANVRQTLWERFAIQRQLEQIYSREVVLPSGGRLVFDQTEALMSIDINSGKISGKANFSSMALKTNLEAAEAIARHLKLRDIGGQIVIDFIEMRDKNHVREVEKTMRTAMKSDRARHDVGRISSFGLLELVRQRTASSALAITMETCPHCRGTGMRRNLEWQSLQALREMTRQGRATQADSFAFETSLELALYLLNHKRQRISEIEEQLGKHIEVRIRT